MKGEIERMDSFVYCFVPPLLGLVYAAWGKIREKQRRDNERKRVLSRATTEHEMVP